MTNFHLSEIRLRPDTYGPIGLSLLAFLVYVAHIHSQGYGGDANLYHAAARDSQWFVQPLHFGYVALLDLCFAVFGPIISNLYVLQGLLSAVAGAVSVWLVAYISRSMVFAENSGWSLVSATFFAFSGGILITANYGETYMLQITFILGATTLLLKRRMLIGGLLLGWSITFTPLSILLMPISLTAIATSSQSIQQMIRDIGTVILGFLVALALAVITIAIYDTGAVSSWLDHAWGSVFNFGDRGPFNFDFVMVQSAWLGRGLHVAIPFALIGFAVFIANRKRTGLLILAAAVVTLVVNLPVMGRVDDFWRMMMIVNVYGAIFASIGLRFAVKRFGLMNQKTIIATASVLIVFSVLSILDMPRREDAVAAEIYQVYLDIKTIEKPAVVISLWENVDSAARYGRNDGFEGLPELVAYPPILNWMPPPEARATVAEATTNGTPIYVIIRERRYDSPLMRLVLGSVDTDFLPLYRSILPKYELHEVGLVGKYHRLYYAEPI